MKAKEVGKVEHTGENELKKQEHDADLLESLENKSQGEETAFFSFAKGLITHKDKLVYPIYLTPSQIEIYYNYKDTKHYSENIVSFEINKKNELVMTDDKVINSTKGIVKELMGTALKMMFKGENPLNISLPSKSLEKCSQLEKNCELFNSLYLLRKAVQVKEPIEKLKYVMTMFACNFYCAIGPKKPFNPYLGETLQGYFKDGSKVYFEHLNHKPMIDAFLVVNEEVGFRIYGKIEIKPKFSGNEIEARFKGLITVELGNTKIYVELCEMKNMGLMIGKIRVKLKGNFYFYYPDANLKGTVTVGPCKDKKQVDRLSGGITTEKTEFDVKTKSLEKGLFGKQIKKNEFISHIQGNWLTEILFDNKQYWNTNMQCMKLLMCEDVLPSDWRYREDLLWKLYGNEKMSNTWKYKLESIQRGYRKQRQNHLKAMKKKKK